MHFHMLDSGFNRFICVAEQMIALRLGYRCKHVKKQYLFIRFVLKPVVFKILHQEMTRIDKLRKISHVIRLVGFKF